MDDRRKRYCPLRNACSRGNSKGVAIVDQPLLQTQNVSAPLVHTMKKDKHPSFLFNSASKWSIKSGHTFTNFMCRIEPKYQEMKSMEIKEASRNGVEVRVIAGESLGVRSEIYTRTPTMFLDFTLKPGAHIRQPIPLSWNAFVYVLEGEGVFGKERCSAVSAHHLLLLGEGDGLYASNKSSKALRFILVGGEPLGEPVRQYGPFVMNTQEQIDQTIEDYENCTNGFEKARQWKSQSSFVFGY